MAVSYLSKIYESNPYLLPVDLNLLAKVNNYKQSLFYKNAENIKSEFNQLNNLDILKGEEAEYAKGKLNNLVTQINNVGGIDYSDMNITNQIEGYGSDIYNDPYVINAVNDTKQIRQLQTNLQKLKTDPKLSKYYSAANEWDALQPVEKYANSGFGQRYGDFGGTTAPTPYKGNVYLRLKDSLAKLKPNITVGFKEGVPYYIDKRTNTRLDPDTVYADIAAQLDGDIINQIGIDARYSLRNYGGNDVVKMYNESQQKRLESLNAQKAALQSQAAAEPNLNEKNQLLAQMGEIDSKLGALNKRRRESNPAELAKTDQGLNSLKFEIYRDDLFDKAVFANSYSQDKSDLVADQAAMFDLKVKLENIRYEHAKGLLDYKAIKKTKEDEAIASGLGTLSYNTQTQEEAEKGKVDLGHFKNQNERLELETNKAWKTFVENIAVETGNSDLLEIDPQTNTSKLLEKLMSLDGKGGSFSLEDARMALWSLDKNGKSMLNPVQKDYMMNLVSRYDAVSTGRLPSESLNGIIVPNDKLTQLINLASTNSMIIESNKVAMENGVKNSKTLSKLSPEAKELYTRVKADPELQEAINYGGTGILLSYKGGKEIATKMGDIDKEVNEYLSQNYRQNYMAGTFSDPDKLVPLSALIVNPERVKGENEAKDLGSFKDVKPIGYKQLVGKTDWEISYQYKDGDKVKTTKPGEGAVISNAQANALGLSVNPRPDAESAFINIKKTPPRYLYTSVLGNEGQFKYTITKNNNDVNNHDHSVQFYYKGRVIPLTRGYNRQPIMSYNSAINFVQEFMSDANMKNFAELKKAEAKQKGYPEPTPLKIKEMLFTDLERSYKQ